MYYTCSGATPRVTLGQHTHRLMSGGKTRSLQPALAVGMELMSPSICGVGGEEPCVGAGPENSSSAVLVLRGRGAGEVAVIPAAHCQISP